jgi:hypothetical protein
MLLLQLQQRIGAARLLGVLKRLLKLHKLLPQGISTSQVLHTSRQHGLVPLIMIISQHRWI